MNQMSEFIQNLRGAMLRDGTGLTDGQLLEDFLSRHDEAALAALVQRHGPMVWGVCRRILPNYHDAEDAFQVTFLVLVRRAASIASRKLFANWLYGVAHQTALKAKATATRRRMRERQVAELPEPAVREEVWRDVLPLLDQELSRLPEKYRALIVLCDLEGKTRKEAARQLDCPEGTVAGRLARARTLLAERLARQGLVLSSGALAAALVSEKAASACVPPLVVASTIKAAVQVAAGQATAVVSAQVAALTKGVVRTMFLSRLKRVAVVALVVGLLATGVGVVSFRGLAGTRDASGSIAAATSDPTTPQAPSASAAPVTVVVRAGARLKAGHVEYIVKSLENLKDVKVEVEDAGVNMDLSALIRYKRDSSRQTDSTRQTILKVVEILLTKGINNIHIGDIARREEATNPTPERTAAANEPTPEQLKEVQNAFASLGAIYRVSGLTKTKQRIHDFRMPAKTTDADLKMLPPVPFPFTLDLQATQVTDAGLKELKDLKQLTGLAVNGMKVTDEGLKELKDFKQLNTLILSNLEGTKGATDAGLKELKDCKQLTALYLTGPRWTDAGLKELRKCKQLTRLILWNTQLDGCRLEGTQELQTTDRPEPPGNAGDGCRAEGTQGPQTTDHARPWANTGDGCRAEGTQGSPTTNRTQPYKDTGDRCRIEGSPGSPTSFPTLPRLYQGDRRRDQGSKEP